MVNKLNIEKIPQSVSNSERPEVEIISETKAEKEPVFEKKESAKASKRKILVKATSTIVPDLDEPDAYQQKQIQAIEEVLSSGLDKTFLDMSPQERALFKSEGEKTALKISTLLSKARVNADKIVKLIKEWLKLIPRVNRYFLEQEAKIKTDKVLNITKKL